MAARTRAAAIAITALTFAVIGPPCHAEAMPDRSRKCQNPYDVNQIASRIVDAVAGALPADESGKNPAAVALGRLGGLKGGRARAAKLSKKKSREIAQKAAKARWKT